MAGPECVAARVAHRLLPCQVGQERGVSGHFASGHTMSVSAHDADVGLESDVDDLVGGHGVKDHLRGDVAGGFHWASDAPQARWLGRGR